MTWTQKGNIRGPQGIQGVQGIQGTQGPKGDTGLQGPQGIKGDTGDTGAQGPIGNTGPQGPQGIPGADSTVPGPQGPQGDIGPQGPQGPKGDTGAQGPVGPAGEGIMVGAMLLWGGPVVPAKFLLCDGAAIVRADYPDLFTALGTSWGAGDGTSTFNLPDLVNFFPRGATSPGATGGSADIPIIDHTHGMSNHTHNMNAHTHGMKSHTHAAGSLVNTNTQGNHDHGVPGYTMIRSAGGGAGIASGSGTFGTVQHIAEGAHGHTINGSTAGPNDNDSGGATPGVTLGPSTNTTAAPLETSVASGTGRNIPPYKSVPYIVRALP